MPPLHRLAVLTLVVVLAVLVLVACTAEEPSTLTSEPALSSTSGSTSGPAPTEPGAAPVSLERLPDEVPAEELVRRFSDWCAGLLVALTGRAASSG